MAKKLGATKAKEILKDGTVHGQPLTKKQRGFFGAVAGGASMQTRDYGGHASRRQASRKAARG